MNHSLESLRQDSKSRYIRVANYQPSFVQPMAEIGRCGQRLYPLRADGGTRAGGECPVLGQSLVFILGELIELKLLGLEPCPPVAPGVPLDRPWTPFGAPLDRLWENSRLATLQTPIGGMALT